MEKKNNKNESFVLKCEVCEKENKFIVTDDSKLQCMGCNNIFTLKAKEVCHQST